jgi:dihydroneopterin aldolase
MDAMTSALPGGSAAAAARGGAEMTVRDLEIWVRLGCSAEERALPQPVAVSARVTFARAPHACESDRLEDTVCYARLAAVLGERAAQRPYQTIESLTFALVEAMRSAMPAGTRFALEVTKLRVPVAGLRGGVTFRLDG